MADKSLSYPAWNKQFTAAYAQFDRAKAKLDTIAKQAPMLGQQASAAPKKAGATKALGAKGKIGRGGARGTS